MPDSPYWRLLALIAILLVTSVIAYNMVAPLYDKPDYEEMRKHSVSRLSDDELRRLYESAKVEFEQNLAKERVKKEEERAKEEREVKLAKEKNYKCASDIAYKERNRRECSPSTYSDLYFPPVVTTSRHKSVEHIFEQKLMGICLSAETVREAKAIGCLP